MPSFPRRVTKPFTHPFSVSGTGLYAITVTATCRSGVQINQYDGEDLRVEIDGMALREIPPVKRTQEYNIPPAWNGTRLQGLPKTVIFVLRLETGQHELNFVPYRGAEILTELVIEPINNLRSFTAIDDQPAEDGDRRPWLTIALVNLPLKSLSLDVTAKWHWRDSDDLKLIIDNKIKPNPSKLAILRRDWLMSGSLLKRLLRNERQQFSFEENLPSGVHYIELWADRKPMVHRLVVNLGQITFERPGTRKHTGTVALYQDIQQTDFVNVRTEPQTTLKDGTEVSIMTRLRNGDKFEIVEERVIGEWVPAKSFIWHKIKHGDHVGYVLSSFVEIAEQERGAIIERIKGTAKEHNADESILLAIAGCESRYKPYATSAGPDKKHQDGSFVAARGIFQLTQPAIQQLQQIHNSYRFEVTDPFDIIQNIEAGVRYYLWLSQTLYAGADQAFEKTIVAWNQGQKFVPPEQPLDFSRFPTNEAGAEARQFLDCVLTNIERKQWDNVSG